MKFSRSSSTWWNAAKLCASLLLLFRGVCSAAALPAPADPLGRLNPRSSVTHFLEACHSGDYGKASQYLDLAGLPTRARPQQGPQLAKDMEDILNAASNFDVLQLSQSAAGNPNDDPDPNIDHVTSVTVNDQTVTLEMELTKQPSGPSVWLFSRSTVAAIPKLTPIPSTESTIEARLPRFLVSNRMLETPIWKWIALVLFAIALIAVFRLVLRMATIWLRAAETRSRWRREWEWLHAIIGPALTMIAAIGFGIFTHLIAPSALTRIYIGRALLLVFVWAIAWGVMNLFHVSLLRINSLLDPRQRVVSHSLIYLGRRVGNVVIVVIAAIVILSNWGYNMTTIIAGLGVGGIAVALAAQQTIANVFGGVSVIGDNPIMVGDFGNFGGLLGTVEDIGMRSTRVRTLSRTSVAIPNSSFAGMNLENYSVRDKILFNPTVQIKRSTPKEQIQHCMEAMRDMLAANKSVEIGPSPIRLSSLSAASFAMEIFAYVLTTDIDEFYKIQAGLFLSMNDVFTNSDVELV